MIALNRFSNFTRKSISFSCTMFSNFCEFYARRLWLTTCMRLVDLLPILLSSWPGLMNRLDWFRQEPAGHLSTLSSQSPELRRRRPTHRGDCLGSQLYWPHLFWSSLSYNYFYLFWVSYGFGQFGSSDYCFTFPFASLQHIIPRRNNYYLFLSLVFGFCFPFECDWSCNNLMY